MRFQITNVEELIQHKDNNHQDQIEWLKKKYANERIRLGVESKEAAVGGGQNEEKLFVNRNSSIPKDHEAGTSHINRGLPDELAIKDNSIEMGTRQLSPLKIRRSYVCNECGLTTIDPREYLYHRRDIHGERMTIHECKSCVYASRHVQKLQRHYTLVHHKSMEEDEDEFINAANNSSPKDSIDSNIPKASNKILDDYEFKDELANKSKPLHRKSTARKSVVKVLKCSECPFQTQNNIVLLQHEKEAHKKKKFYHCMQCGYGTNNKSRFTRHLKYHALPKLKCEYCDFKSAYKWNMDRHMKNHMEQGEFECNKCSFTTNTKQSLTVHLDYHHGNSIHPKSRKYNLETSSDLSMEQFVMQDDSGSHSSADDDSDSFENADTFDISEDKPLDINYFEDFYEDERGNLSKHEYKYKRNSESTKKHCCPICDAQFPQLSSVGQHLKEEHSESVEANNIAVVVDMLTPRRKTRSSESSIERQHETSGSSKMQEKEKTRLEPTCNICGYKTRWTSEMIKHQRVHSGEKPFECNICNYKCRWKGDLTRHFEKFHKQRIPTPEFLSLDKIKVAQDENGSTSRHSAGVDMTRDSLSSDQDGPLDLTIANKIEKCDDFLAKSNYLKINHKLISTRESLALKRKFEYEPPLVAPPSKVLVKKYQCTYCGFMTKTASRFHVHIVQHFNKRPFVCSICGYRSNWQWDITKHIKMKAIRDNSHSDATVLITDETGNKNYDKYKQYLVEVEERKDGRTAEKQDFVQSEGTSKRKRIQDDDDESMASGIAEPENIVVTPDLPFSLEENNQANSAAVLADQRQKAFRKFFYCKHCPLKHQEKKFVVSHLAVHAGIKLFYCKLCDFSTNWRHVILRHIRLSHNGDLELLESRVTYTTEGRIIGITDIKKEHWINENTVSRPKPIGASLRCEICPYSCQKEAHMKVHMKQHQPRDGANLKCMFCPYYVKFRKTLILHLELHKTSDDTSNVEDNKNSNADSTNNSMNIYKEANESENIDNVAFTFENLNNLSNRKKRLLLGKKKHVCEQCPYQTENKTQYLYHKQFHRPNKAAKYKCKLCSYWATHQHLMSQHLKVHNINKSYTLIGIDPESNKLVHSSQEVDENNSQVVDGNQQSNQIQPVIVKKGDVYFRMYKCSYCPMMNKRRANVRIHQKMHLKSKLTKYSCPLCNYKCNNQGIISAHMKIHGKDITDAVVNNPNSHGDVELIRTNVNESAKKKIFNYFCMKCPAVFKTSADMQIHKTFHGALYPYQCPHCDYRAKHKPHLHKHLLVHTPEYIAKREISHGPPVVANIAEGGTVARTSEANQMMLLEEAEMKAVMAGTVTKRPYKLHRCTFCPAMFFKSTTLQYHTSLHKSNGLFRCSHCNYAVDSKINLMTHDKLHTIQPRKPKSKQVPGFMCCPKCPAMFNKVDRFHRHLRLHGQNNKYTCEHCDYSVQLQANLFNHKVVHTKSYADRKRDVNIVSSELAFSADNMPLFENVKVLEENDNKPYVCDRCPYHHPRKETVQNHQKYHNSNEGMKCPYCDYFSSQPLFMRDHIKVHFQTEIPVQPQGFTKNENVEIWCVVDGKREILFRDRGADVFKSKRFFPPEEEMQQRYANGDCDSSPVSPKNVSMLNVPIEQTSLDTKETNNTENLIPNCLSNEKSSSDIEQVLGDKEEFVPISQNVTTALTNEEIHDKCDVKLSTINGTNGNLSYKNMDDAEELCIIEDDDNFVESSDLCDEPNSMVLSASEKNEEFVVEEEDKSINACGGTLSSVQGNLYGGTNNNTFNTDLVDNEELQLNLNSYYFDTSKDNTATNIANVVELEWRTDEASEQVITDVMMSEGCEQIGESEMEVGAPASDDPSSSIGRDAFADSSAEDGCNRSELMSDTDGNILSEVSMQI
ncbi:zinc finger protein 729-like isoform X2 [Centruroides sculpturatus]|uniref:zinc finger protein 729-like isoform X2 n=1 Tax=Centruroides sculpturatus TaxID=218467 RepID=UPI000C6D17D7|nr:zinc finger protein 729-like isoform X2 [Centruroides sculpturatus]XP_023236352.1 zinc finger protein 729-like isoform X2 [Centruroides sculpturatus]XP_023236353.1 zinc finger protein 729-like isoform X2 [Centruroides sculpturatus]